MNAKSLKEKLIKIKCYIGVHKWGEPFYLKTEMDEWFRGGLDPCKMKECEDCGREKIVGFWQK